MTSIGGGRPRPSPIVKLFSFFAPKTQFQASVRIDGEHWPVSIPSVQQAPTKVHVAATYSEPLQSASVEAMVEVPLLRIAHGRSGDKGNSVNIGVIARDPKWIGVLRAELTAERVREYLAIWSKVRSADLMCRVSTRSTSSCTVHWPAVEWLRRAAIHWVKPSPRCCWICRFVSRRNFWTNCRRLHDDSWKNKITSYRGTHNGFFVE